MNGAYVTQDVAVDLLRPGGLFDWNHPQSRNRVNILDGISISIGAGEIVGLVGESGSGKTTLARVMMGLQPASSGHMVFDGKELHGRKDFSAFRRISALMFQDPIASLSPRRKVGALVTEPFVIHGISVPDMAEKAAELLERVGLPAGIAQRYPHELSGGQARRVCVARALALNPRFVIADEPTAGLDVSVQAEILNLMTNLKRELGISFLIISHNLAVVRHISDRVAILYLGRLVEEGPTRDVFAWPLHPYTRSLIASEPQPDPRKRRKEPPVLGEIPSVLARPMGCVFHTRCPLVLDRCRTEEPLQCTLAPGRSVRCHFAEQPETNKGGNP